MSQAHFQFDQKTPNPSMPKVEDVDPIDVFSNKDQLCLIDVRQPEEFTGPLGHIPGANLIPLGELEDKIATLSKEKTIVFVCRSGGRSAGATSIALDSGFESVYNMQGGMILWNEKEFATEGKSE